MNKYRLPTSIEIKGVDCTFNTDFRDILEIFKVLNDPDLLENEKIAVALQLFYTNDRYFIDVETAIKEMFDFMTCGDAADDSKANKRPLYDWEQDFNIIVAPVNKIIGTDVRGMDYLHWWTFLSAFMEIGECTFSTFVSIRDKKNNNKKLDKTEERIFRDNRDKIILKKRVDKTTQDLMDAIMGKGV